MMVRSIVFALFVAASVFGSDTEENSVAPEEDTNVSVDTAEAASGDIQSTSPESTAVSGEATAAPDVPDTTESVEKVTVRSDSTGEKQVQVTEKNEVAATTTVKKIKLRKRDYNYKQQIRLAVGMMAFIAITMMTAQNLNPK